MNEINKRVHESQKKKFAQYGYYDAGQTKQSKVDFDGLMTSLNKINTDLKSLSITVEKLKHNREASHGTLGELRDFLNHVIDAKKHLKSIAFQTFIPSEIDQVKTVYETIEEFLGSINAYVDFDLVKETQTKEDLKIELDRLKHEYETVQKGRPRSDPEKEKKMKDKEFLSDEISRIQEEFRIIQDNIDFDGNLSTSSVFKMYSANIIDLKMLIEGKILRNENVVKGLAKTICGSQGWKDHHQGTEFI